ncbi:Yip1 family protein [Niallia circulans]|uniref:Yip1 family protein n=1 Tax=Niallia circulans TaxID=1397 RepID=UPI003008473D
MVDSQNFRRGMEYAFIKLAGAGFAATLFFSYIFLSSFDLYLFSHEIENPYFWIGFFGFGILISIVIDWISNYFPKLELLLYIVVGVCLFLPIMWNVLPVLAIVSGFSAILFYIGIKIAAKVSWFKWIFACTPILFLLLTIPDFTVKKEWNTVRGEQSYEAYFAYFNGEDEVPIKAKKGERVTVHIDFTNRNGGGFGYYLIDEKNRRIGLSNEEKKVLTFDAKKTETYKLIVTGDGLQGGFEVNWEKE